MRWNPKRVARSARAAFTLLELIVVISIIIVLASASVAVLTMFGRGSAAKHGGRIVQSQFYRARQLSASTRVYHFLRIEAFRAATTDRLNRMSIHRDNPTGASPRQYDGGDALVGTPVDLPKGVDFKVRGTVGAPQPQGIPDPFILIFRPDGSLGSTPAKADIPAPAALDPLPGLPDPAGDIILVQQDGAGGCIVDYSLPAGKIMKIIYHPGIGR